MSHGLLETRWEVREITLFRRIDDLFFLKNLDSQTRIIVNDSFLDYCALIMIFVIISLLLALLSLS
jgi:hypothetical protein